MARDDYAGAAKVLETLTKSSTAGLYARYNLGVALVRSGDAPRGIAMLDELGKSAGAERRAAQACATRPTSRSASPRCDDKPEEARALLERVRLSSMHANKALLGFGWAAAALKEPKQALVPWTELAGSRDASDAAVLEARIAVPYAYAELGAYGQALERYKTRSARSSARTRARRVDRRDPRRQAGRRPARAEPRRRDGLVLEHRASCPSCRTPAT